MLDLIGVYGSSYFIKSLDWFGLVVSIKMLCLIY